jgi:TolB-like protein/cytochrome c-type biogenesis protein CcmH/NrfG
MPEGSTRETAGLAEARQPDSVDGAETATSGAGSNPNPAGAVFISYASKDVAAADAVVATLEGHGVACWIAPRDVKPGALYAEAIVRAISDAKALVLVLSENSVASAHVSKEVERASSKRRPVIALRIDDAPLSPALEYFLSESHWVDARAGGLDSALAKLIAAIRDPEPPAPGIVSPVTPGTPAGATSVAHPRSPRKRILLATGIVVVLATLVALLVDKFWLARQTPTEQRVAAVTSVATPSLTAISDKSIAVLPFTDMSEKKDEEYFSDGLSEEVIDHLAHAPDLKVIARTSSFQFKGKNEDTRTIGRRLGVANLLEGSVRKSGNALRISVQLVRADTGYHVWSETYDRKPDDIFKIQDEIAVAVVHALKATLIGESTAISPNTQNMEAYNLYLRGHAIYNREITPTSYKTAIQYFRSALRADPNYARAWAILSDALAEQGENGFVPMDAVREEARRAAQRALELNPSLADAHVAMGRYLIVDELDVADGEPHIRRALEVEPTNQWALGWAGTLASMRGQFQNATALLQKSIVSDPANPFRYGDLATNYFLSGKYPEALDAYHRKLDLYPADSDRHLFPGKILLAQGEPLSALAEIDRESDAKVRLGCNCRALALDALGRKAEADSALTYLIKNRADDDAYGIAAVYAGRGNLDQAFNWFDRAYRQRDNDLLDMKVDPLLKNVRSDPRFTVFLNKLGLVD